MKQLVKGETPGFLTKFIAHKQPKVWDDISPIRQQLRKHILEEQNKFCAYTELRINTVDDCHIDHYHTRNLYPDETFEYSNMLVSCNSEEYGAKYKDKQVKIKEDYKELVNPVEDLPTDFIEFGLTGRANTVGDCTKGKQTISFFNLNEKSLVQRRKTVVANLLQMKDYLTEDEMVESLGEFETLVRQLYKYCTKISVSTF